MSSYGVVGVVGVADDIVGVAVYVGIFVSYVFRWCLFCWCLLCLVL